MKVTKVSDHIWSIKAWMLIPVHVWLVVDDDGVTLVDGGIGRMKEKIMAVIQELDAGPLRRIVLTHGHSDHVGSVQGILAETNVPVYAHPIEIPYMEGERNYPKRKKAEQNVPKNIVQPLETDKRGELQTIGGIKPYFTPGHSPGHVIYYHEADKVILAGDLFTSKKGKLHSPISMFTADMGEAVRSSSIVEQLKPFRLEVCHGQPILNPAEQLAEYQTAMAAKQS
ncbi:MBL fold metallo-hydrolase [Cytobacillus purgationiresistens]|uniref:Glyoxylase-like metal-dependent hydrolase (Beta-lactamase superfamily II) n=1 Tax=Cytobacillus purgationiresistens TaxID=863449 RepID=A0ABU0APG3_9BACI|nr:MBL fold metallo-hydrolase [Cytobacillus purgationiresistens]MDQ0273178.1 glyoxylase-like metal-dependent hydrolase (beta-lactamase superfamily II) [Cytobacillus purgationiresistens]